MAASTAPINPIRFNVQPPFQPKAAKLSRDPFRRLFANRLSPPWQRKPPGGLARSYPKLPRAVKPDSSGFGANGPYLREPAFPRQARGPILCIPWVTREFGRPPGPSPTQGFPQNPDTCPEKGGDGGCVMSDGRRGMGNRRREQGKTWIHKPSAPCPRVRHTLLLG